MPYFTRFHDCVRVKFTHGEFAKLPEWHRAELYRRAGRKYSDRTHEVLYFTFPQWGLAKPLIPGSQSALKPKKAS